MKEERGEKNGGARVHVRANMCACICVSVRMNEVYEGYTRINRNLISLSRSLFALLPSRIFASLRVIPSFILLFTLIRASRESFSLPTGEMYQAAVCVCVCARARAESVGSLDGVSIFAAAPN